MIDAKINLMYSERKNKNMNSQMKKIRNEFLAKQKK